MDEAAREDTERDYEGKRAFDRTPEPRPEVTGNVDPGTAPPGRSFVIHQHHARRLHFDLRLEMLNGEVPVLVSWAVPKNLPRRRGDRTLAIHVEDHPIEYGSFSGTIPEGNYGAGEVRVFDAGTYELLEQRPGKLTFRLRGGRLSGVYHLVRTKGEKDEWLALLSEDEREPPEAPPPPEPMLATPSGKPFDSPDWVFEPKWDGVRAIAVCEEQTRLVSRNVNDITVAYPELHGLHERLVALNAMVDGEIVAMDGGRPSFERLQSRMHVRNPRDIERLSKSTPVTYIAFDLIYLDGRSLVGQPWVTRRQALEETVVPATFLQLSPSIRRDGVALFEAARARELEGVVAKKVTSRYEPGRRSRSWLKIKTSHEADVVVGGWTQGSGKRAGTIGALLVGAYEGAELRYVGSVGTGFDEGGLARVLARLRDLAQDQPPFAARSMEGARAELRHAQWVRPELVAKVEYRQLTGAGRLRAASFQGLHDGKRPRGCRFEDLTAAAPPGDDGAGEP